MQNKFYIVLLFSLLSISIYAQDNWMLRGYVKGMTAMQTIDDGGMSIENTLHNRFDLNWYINDNFTFTAGLRNRIIAGNNVALIPNYSNYVGRDVGYFDLSWVWADENSWIGVSQLDRLMIDYSIGNFQVTVGRQRINWGQSFVWNPNDIFNSYSYFEVDYPERPGSDALRMSYYTGNASTIELAAKLDSANRVTAAGYFRFNTLGFDIQLLGGVYQGEDLVLGTGWSGNIGSSAFRGEVSYFKDLEQFKDTSGYLMTSIGFDYSFSNSLMIQLEGLYSAFARDLDVYSFLQFYSGSLDVKNLGFTEWSLFVNVTYPLTPLLNGGFATIWYPEWKGVYLGPSFDLSLNSNIDLSLILQHFTAEFEDPSGVRSRENNTFGFLRFKWSF